MAEPYDPLFVSRVGAYLEDRRLACGYPTAKAFSEAAGVDAKTIGWLIKGRPENVNGSRFSARVLDSVENALKLPRGSIEDALQTGELDVFERKPKRTTPEPLPAADPDRLAAISRDVHNILWRLPVGEPARMHLAAAIHEIERAIHDYPDQPEPK
jgi:hypothetical protein